MGTDPAHPITDADDGVWGHNNLLIADATRRLTNGASNMVLIMTALAYRAADHILSIRGARVPQTSKSTI